MNEKDNRSFDLSLDLLGAKPIAESIHTLTEASVKGSSAFLSRICLPAAKELGLLLRDHVREWRSSHANKIVAKAESLVSNQADFDKLQAHPRLVAKILEQGSWADSNEVQNMWAGLLASSCTIDGFDDSNLIFIDILAQITLVEARILERACKDCKKKLTKAGWIMSDLFSMSLEQLQACSGISDFHRIDRELDHLRMLGLIGGGFGGGFGSDSTEADVTPTSLSLQMYARCNGWNGDPLEFFNLSRLSDSDTGVAA